MRLFFILLILNSAWVSYCQSALTMDGGFLMDSSSVEAPEDGTIRWTGSDLEGWNGINWVSLTGRVLGSISDISGNSYKTLKLGQETWMIENLKTHQLNDGTLIEDITISSEWKDATSPAICRYDNANVNLETYGYLYNIHAVEDDLLCPVGWHVSTAEEWEALLELYGGSLVAGAALKEVGNIHWLRPNTGASNESGFGALPGGSRTPQGDFIDKTMYGSFWALDTTGMVTQEYKLGYISIEITRLNVSAKNSGFSVRCVMNNN